MNEKLPPLYPPPTNDENYLKFTSQQNLHDQEYTQSTLQPTLPQPLNIPQSPFQSDYISPQCITKNELAMQSNQFVDVSYGRKDWLAWSVVSLVIFFPLFVFWVPALVCSITARNKFLINDIKGGKFMANIALILNITCLVCACIGYLCAIIVPLTIASKACEDNACYRYCNFIKTKYVCYDDYTNYVQQTNPMYYSNCKYSYYSGTYLCLTDYKFKDA